MTMSRSPPQGDVGHFYEAELITGTTTYRGNARLLYCFNPEGTLTVTLATSLEQPGRIIDVDAAIGGLETNVLLEAEGSTQFRINDGSLIDFGAVPVGERNRFTFSDGVWLWNNG